MILKPIKKIYEKSSKKALIYSNLTWATYYAGSLYFYPIQSYDFQRFILDYSLSYGVFIGSYFGFSYLEKNYQKSKK